MVGFVVLPDEVVDIHPLLGSYTCAIHSPTRVTRTADFFLCPTDRPMMPFHEIYEYFEVYISYLYIYTYTYIEQPPL